LIFSFFFAIWLHASFELTKDDRRQDGDFFFFYNEKKYKTYTFD